MDFYQALMNGSTDMSNPISTLGEALNAPPPTVQMPERPKPQDEMLPALSLFHLAAGLARQRQMGQSRLSQALDSVANTGDYAMRMKAANEDRANKQYGQDLQAAQTKAALQQAAVATQGAQQKNAMERAKAPYEMANLEFAIKSANSKQELDAIQLKLAKVKERFAEDEAQANLALTRAKTDAEKDEAQAKLQQAQAALKSADAHIATAKAAGDRVQLERESFEEGKKAGDFKVNPGLPGEQESFTYRDSKGGVQTGFMPMDQGTAIKKAKNDWKLAKDVGMTQGKDEETWIKERIQQLTNPASYQAAVADMSAKRRGATVPPSQSAPPGAPTSSQPSTSGTAVPSAQQEAMRRSTNNPNIAVVWDGGAEGKKYFIAGKEVPESVVQARAKASTPPATKPQAQGAPEKKAPATGAYAQERDELQSEIDRLQADAMAAPDVQTKSTIALRIGVLQRSLLRLEAIAQGKKPE